MKYRIGEVSRILGVSPETLRFFEAKGIVSPQHDPKSSYRYFDSLDVNKMVAYLNYRRMGFPLDEALRLVSRCELSFLREELGRRREAIAAERERLERAQSRVESLAASLDAREGREEALEIAVSPALYFFANQEGRDFRLSEATLKSARRWLRELPEAFPYARILSGPSETTMLWGFAKRVPADFPASAPPDIPPERCAHGFFLVPDTDPLLEGPRTTLEEWGASRSLALTGLMHGTILHELERDGQIFWLFDLYAPIAASSSD